ncbi:sigma-54 dependent transcriptional regulator [Curvibacter sp. APW13]|uniref:sigma-54-dependent transcriptional regulator n=1 Tax=Curvibacter sp. APW13 TaxID=3077236 RepID=UPI0028DE30AF|nr:sigma-54 dependent transcriptional regulator [Curvibacter sp. APW13]MDT8989768.1 sigma-54 dependent transcriptional regulator [Curvibacter sp. APW13]
MATHPVLREAHVLVVDDEPDLRTLYELTLLREGYRVDTAESVAQAQQLLKADQFDVVLTDMRLPDGSGTDILTMLKSMGRSERCVVITAYGSAENAVSSLKAGAFDYLTKPVDLRQFRNVVNAAIQEGQTIARAVKANTAVNTPNSSLSDERLMRLVGQSACMQQVRERIVKVARSMAPVMVCGESGTGKELVAQAIHHCSHRARGPWVAVNCSAIPEHLLEAEFFGARKGAFTGATQDRPGFFQAADGGTLFLDEIGDLPQSMQAKLLRVIQERSVRALGATQEEAVDVRIVSATHKHLPTEVQAGRFRQDLYYRLHVIDIQVPPLRERLEDLPDLCSSLLQRIAKDSGLPAKRISPTGLEQLRRLPLAGNVRELENLLHSAVALSDGDEIDLNELQPRLTTDRVDGSVEGSAPPPGSGTPTLVVPQDLQAHLDQEERRILVQVLQNTGYNRTLAAQRLGISLRQMRYRIDRLGIDIPGTGDGD